ADVCVAVLVGVSAAPGPPTRPVTIPVALVTIPVPPAGTTAVSVNVSPLPLTTPLPDTCPVTGHTCPLWVAHGTPACPLGRTWASACCAVSPGPNTTDTSEPSNARPVVVPLHVTVAC